MLSAPSASKISWFFLKSSRQSNPEKWYKSSSSTKPTKTCFPLKSIKTRFAWWATRKSAELHAELSVKVRMSLSVRRKRRPIRRRWWILFGGNDSKTTINRLQSKAPNLCNQSPQSKWAVSKCLATINLIQNQNSSSWHTTNRLKEPEKRDRLSRTDLSSVFCTGNFGTLFAAKSVNTASANYQTRNPSASHESIVGNIWYFFCNAVLPWLKREGAPVALVMNERVVLVYPV